MVLEALALIICGHAATDYARHDLRIPRHGEIYEPQHLAIVRYQRFGWRQYD
jgi:hypothetical protein